MNAPLYTTARIADGSKATLVFGAGYVFGVSTPTGKPDAVSGRLESRAANGDFVVLVDSSDTRKRVRPAKILSIVGDGLDLSPIPAQRNDETSTEYLARLELDLTSSDFAVFVGTDAGQTVLADAQAEDRSARKASLRSGISSILAGKTDAATVLASVAVAPVIRRAGIAGGRTPAIGPKPISEIFATQVVVDGTVIAETRKIDLAAPVVDIFANRPAAAIVDDLVAKAEPSVATKLRAIVDRPAKSAGRPYADRNHIWKCGTCKRRTRVPVCTGKPDGSHDPVTAPSGKRRDDR